MGLRLDIYKKTDFYYGTKLYGYVDERELKSFQYLKDLCKVDDETYFGYGCDVYIELYRNEMLRFLELYKEDYENCWSDDGYVWAEFEELIKRVKRSKKMDTFILEWN